MLDLLNISLKYQPENLHLVTYIMQPEGLFTPPRGNYSENHLAAGGFPQKVGVFKSYRCGTITGRCIGDRVGVGTVIYTRHN